MPLPETLPDMAAVIDRSVGRMTNLIDNVLDFARVRLGGGLGVARRDEPNLQSSLEHVVTELRMAQPQREIESDVQIAGVVYCDPARLGQLLSNLVSNALTHGDPKGPVRIRARNQDGFVLSVTNAGPRIPQETIARLFMPFVRGNDRSGAQGLGLGLYIASEIARARRIARRVFDRHRNDVYISDVTHVCFLARCSLRSPHAEKKRGPDAGDRRVPGNRDRR